MDNKFIEAVDKRIIEQRDKINDLKNEKERRELFLKDRYIPILKDININKLKDFTAITTNINDINAQRIDKINKMISHINYQIDDLERYKNNSAKLYKEWYDNGCSMVVEEIDNSDYEKIFYIKSANIFKEYTDLSLDYDSEESI